MKNILLLIFFPFCTLCQVQTVKIVTLSPAQADFITGAKYDAVSFFLVQKTSKNVPFITQVEVLAIDINLFRNLSFLKSLPVQTYTFIPVIESTY